MDDGCGIYKRAENDYAHALFADSHGTIQQQPRCVCVVYNVSGKMICAAAAAAVVFLETFPSKA